MGDLGGGLRDRRRQKKSGTAEKRRTIRFPEETADKSFYFAGNDKLVFASEQDGWNHLYSLTTSGGGPTLLTPGSFEVEDVTLSADRRSVIFSSNQEDVDRRHLWRVGLEGGRPQALTRGETMEWSPVETGAEGKAKPGDMPRFQRDRSGDADSRERRREGNCWPGKRCRPTFRRNS